MISPFFQCATVQNSIRNFLLVGAISLPSDPFIGPRIVPVKSANRRVGSYQEVGTYRSTFAVISLWGKFGGLHACGDTFPHIVPLPNIFLTLLFSKPRLKRKDFQQIARLAWAQEASGSNPDAPTNIFGDNDLQKGNLGIAALWCNLGTIRKSHAE